jgi:hypothetical protein
MPSRKNAIPRCADTSDGPRVNVFRGILSEPLIGLQSAGAAAILSSRRGVGPVRIGRPSYGKACATRRFSSQPRLAQPRSEAPAETYLRVITLSGPTWVFVLHECWPHLGW